MKFIIFLSLITASITNASETIIKESFYRISPPVEIIFKKGDDIDWLIRNLAYDRCYDAGTMGFNEACPDAYTVNVEYLTVEVPESNYQRTGPLKIIEHSIRPFYWSYIDGRFILKNISNKILMSTKVSVVEEFIGALNYMPLRMRDDHWLEIATYDKGYGKYLDCNVKKYADSLFDHDFYPILIPGLYFEMINAENNKPCKKIASSPDPHPLPPNFHIENGYAYNLDAFTHYEIYWYYEFP